MVIYPIPMVYETTNQSLLVTAGMPAPWSGWWCPQRSSPMPLRLQKSVSKVDSTKNVFLLCIHIRIYIYICMCITHVHYTSLYLYIYTLCSFFTLSLYIYDAVVYTQQPNTVKGIGQRQMWHGLNAAILATESHIHLLAITLGQAIAQPRSGSGRESWNALKTAVLRWCLGTQRCT